MRFSASSCGSQGSPRTTVYDTIKNNNYLFLFLALYEILIVSQRPVASFMSLVEEFNRPRKQFPQSGLAPHLAHFTPQPALAGTKRVSQHIGRGVTRTPPKPYFVHLTNWSRQVHSALSIAASLYHHGFPSRTKGNASVLFLASRSLLPLLTRIAAR